MEINIIHNTNCESGLKTLPDNSINCCVTSPPYFGLRDYGTAKWVGGNPDCPHSERQETGFENSKQSSNRGNSKNLPKTVCRKCGAIRIDEQIGLEETLEQYITRLTTVFSEVYRVLRQDGTLWLNIGDSYYNGKHDFIKQKDLIGIPWMLAFALRSSGWYLRQDIIWHKPNPMPESVHDRCTKSHEYIFLLSKSQKYYFNSDIIKEPQSETTFQRFKNKNTHAKVKQSSKDGDSEYYSSFHRYAKNGILPDGLRNKRSVWTVASERSTEKHFAMFPQKLITDCINAGCPDGGIVLDPFMGSGTTAVVARKLNKNYIGFELNPDYVAIANRKLYREIGLWA
jgi:DNA modification methylase